MGTVTIHFIGLFLFTSEKEGGGKRVAVIDAGRDDVFESGKKLNKHEAFFTVSDTEPEFVDWPKDVSHYELAGTIRFNAQGPLSEDQWALPHLKSDCQSLVIPDSFFDVPSAGATHAIIVIRAGELCSWRFITKDGSPGAINTQLTIETAESFVITRDDGKRIQLSPANDHVIIFTNTEPIPTTDVSDWSWYYIAAGSPCRPAPDDTGIIAPCKPPPGMNPLSLGCSNSNYP